MNEKKVREFLRTPKGRELIKEAQYADQVDNMNELYESIGNDYKKRLNQMKHRVKIEGVYLVDFKPAALFGILVWQAELRRAGKDD